jgi:hypothetical protein
MLSRSREARRPRRHERVGFAVGNLLVVTAVLLAPRLSPEPDASGHAIAIRPPSLYSSGIISVYIGLLVAVAALASSYYSPLVLGVHGVGTVVGVGRDQGGGP